MAVERFEPERIPASRIVGALPAPSPPVPFPGPLNGDDALREIEPAVYVRVLLGVDVPRHRKIPCPFHRDDSPSLHVYETAEGGWYCYGCGRCGSIYDFAAELWGLGTRGADFLELRRRLSEIFLAGGRASACGA